MPNKKQIVKKAISLREVHPIPYLLTFTPAAAKNLQLHLQNEDIESFLGNYAAATVTNTCHSVAPADLKPGEWKDDFGVIWQTTGQDRGSPAMAPLANGPSLKNYKFPDPADPLRFEHLEKFLKDNSDLFTIISLDFGLLFERAWYLRGMADLLMDFYTNPAFVEDLLDNLTDYYLASIDIIAAYKGIDAVCLIDDYGIQQKMVMAPDTWRRFFKPRLAEISNALAKHNIIAHLHCCGDVIEIIDDFIEIGIKLLDPIQPEAMDIKQIKSTYGRKLAFLGGFSTQQTIPHGTKQQVRKHVEDCLKIMGQAGGYIASNGIPLQTDVPLENILTIIDVLKNQ